MARLNKHEARRKLPPFLRLTHAMLDSEAYRSLSPRGRAMLVDLGRQYTGTNNGDLQMAFSYMKARGWTSKDQMYKAVRELMDRGFVIKTRQGGRSRLNRAGFSGDFLL